VHVDCVALRDRRVRKYHSRLRGPHVNGCHSQINGIDDRISANVFPQNSPCPSLPASRPSGRGLFLRDRQRNLQQRLTRASTQPLPVPQPLPAAQRCQQQAPARDPTPGPDRPQGIIRHGQQRVHVGLHNDTSAGQKVTVARRPPRRTRRGRPRLGECHYNRRNPSWYSGRSTQRPSRPRRSPCNRLVAKDLRLPWRQGGPLPAGAPATSKTVVRSRRTTLRGRGRSPAERQRIRRRKLRWPPTRGRRRPCCGAERRRVRVHYIGVNWPHHIFVNQDFKVTGASD